MSSQRCADITAEAHVSTLPTEGPTTCCGPQVWVQRGTHEIHPTQSGHPDPDSSQLSFTCTTNTSKPYRRSLHSSSPSVIQDSLFNTHPKSRLQHPTHSTCWQTNPTYKWAKKQLVWLPTFLKGMDSPGGSVWEANSVPCVSFLPGWDEHGQERQDKGTWETLLPVSCLLAALFSWPASL